MKKDYLTSINRKKSYALRQTIISIFFLTAILFASQSIIGQSIPATDGGVVCFDCAPPGWIKGPGTPDVSDATNASTLGGWDIGTLPLPPNGHTTWLSLRDLGAGAINEEDVSAIMGGLIPGATYEVTIYSMTTLSATYSPTYIDEFTYQVGTNPLQTISSVSQDTWGTNTFEFIASGTSDQLFLKPGFNGGGGSLDFESVQISVTLNAIVRIAAPDIEITGNSTTILDGQTIISIDDDTDLGETVVGVPVTQQFTLNNIGNLDLTITTPLSINNLGSGVSDFSITNPLTLIAGAGTTTFDVTFTPTVAGTQEVEIFIVSDDPDENPYTFNIRGTGLLDSDGDTTADIYDLDDDNDGILDTVEGLIDTDGDGVFNNLDLDSDNDGIFDVVESGGVDIDNNGLIDGFTDADSNGFNDSSDNPELYSQNNAASTITEANATAGWIANGVGTALSSSAAQARNGAFSLEFTTTIAGSGKNMAYSFPVTNGTTYNIRIWARRGTTDEGIFANWTGFAGFTPTNFTNDDWTLYEWTLTANAAVANIEIYPHFFSSGINGSIYVDEVSIKEVVTQVMPNNDPDPLPNFLDLDSDNDGIPDNIEAQPTIGYVSPDAVYNANGVDTAYLTGLNPVNTDGAADNPDYLDLNSDDEGGNDTAEAGLLLSGLVGANGLDTNSETLDTYLDVNGIFDNPQGDFPDSDGDVPFGGDVDYRDDFDNPDYDGDSVPDIGDLDDDNDGILDTDESGGLNPSLDGDGDNVPFYLDDDDGNAGVGDLNGVIEPGFDFDGDGIPNHLDLDSDNDGTPDVIEAGGTDADNDGILDGFVDTDGDGLNDIIDNVDSGSGPGEVTTGTPLTDPNTDGDTVPDRLDLDSDNDGITDVTEAGGTDANGDGIIDGFTDVGPINGWDDTTQITPLVDPNTDGDSLPNRLDLDSDNDGVTDATEAGGIDANGDGLIDGFTDADTNGLDDATETTPLIDPNTDGDTLPNRLDLDSDNDGITDTTEAGGIDANGDGLIDGFTDADTNGLDDATETTPLTDPNTDGDSVPDRLDLDSDNDGITDTTEAGGLDTDGDGLIDGFTDAGPINGLDDATEVTPLTDLNTDGDSVPDRLDLDSDNDGITDTTEAGGTDANGDGIVDGFADADTNGLDDTTETTPLTNPDTDGDEIVDRLDLDSDNDGITDAREAGRTDVNSDGIIDGFTDADTNGLDDTIETTFLPITNTDLAFTGDSLPDYLDLDSDADGISDIIEAGGIDTDNDGRVDYVTSGDPTTLTDANNNGLEDSLEGAPLPVTNSDTDALANYIDIDADGDGIVDNIEAQVSLIGLGGYRAPTGVDSDGDGIDDAYDVDNLGVIIPLDIDGDLTPDYIDTNSDDDADDDILEGWDVNNDGAITGGELSPNGSDSDNDGLDNGFDLVPAGLDPTNGGQNASIFPDLDTPGGEPDWREALDIDYDNDGVDDVADLDDDNDGIPDTDESGGNEPNGDADGDGIQNWLDITDGGGPGDGSATDYTDADGNGIPDVYDGDGDGVPNHFDLDSDNDGIFDVVESGQLNGTTLVDNDNGGNGDGILDAATPVSVGVNGLLDLIENAPDSGVLTTATADSDGDGIPDSNELDADNDGCNDVIEAGYTDPEMVGDPGYGLLGSGGIGTGLTVDPLNGTVTSGVDGYTTPNDNDTNGILDFQEAGAAIVIDVAPQNQIVILNANANFDVTLSSGVTPTYEWFESANGGTDPFLLISNGGIYSGADTATLTINANALTLDQNRYFVTISAPGYACAGSVSSLPVTLTVQSDFDGDGIGDPVDLDDDNDGIPDSVEGIGDLDGDGSPNHQDLDADGDGIYDTNEGGFADLDGDDDGVIDGIPADFGANGLFNGLEDNDTAAAVITYTPLDTDNDGIINVLDVDDDNDGVNTENENPVAGVGPGDPSNAQDTDGDSVFDYLDIDDDNDGILTATEGTVNSDTDSRPNYLDQDSDNDGIADNVEGQTTAGYVLPTGNDTDGDGLDDAYDNFDDLVVNDPNNNATTNGIQAGAVNTDAGIFGADLLPDYLDDDSDGDNVPDSIEGHDLNNDGIQDNFIIGDTDNDGLDDAFDGDTSGYGDPNGAIVTTDPATDLPDTDSTEDVNFRDVDDDGDGIHTRFEDLNGDGDFSNDDTDGDGIPNYLDNDDDGDGILTADENPDPNGDGNPADAQDGDSDGIPDYLDDDDDNDGISTLDEDVDGDGDPTNDDSDGDGRPNYLDIDDDNDGIMTIVETNNDEDGDTFPNHLDLDADDDGIPDNVEGQTTAGYIAPDGVDADNDGLDDAYDNDIDGINDLANFEASNGIQPVNTDATATINSDADPDYLDTDADGDTVPDSIEGHNFNAEFGPDVEPLNQDVDMDGLDDAYDSDLTGFSDPSGTVVDTDPATDLPNFDGVDEVNYRDVDDDNDGVDTADEDGDMSGDSITDDCDEDGNPNYVDVIPCDRVPSGFSPNDDGNNDTLVVPALSEYKNFTMEVYDRYGNIVYDYDNAGREDPLWWDGFSTGARTIKKGDKVPVGTYYYIINFNQDRISPIAGWVYINY